MKLLHYLPDNAVGLAPGKLFDKPICDKTQRSEPRAEGGYEGEETKRAEPAAMTSLSSFFFFVRIDRQIETILTVISA